MDRDFVMNPSRDDDSDHINYINDLNRLSALVINETDYGLESLHSLDDSTSMVSFVDPRLSESNSCTHLTGRKKNEFTKILENFYTGKARHPKKEFFNAYMIRSIKRLYRYVSKKKVPLKTSIGINMNNTKHAKLWSVAKQIYKENPKYITKFTETDFEPSTPGKNKKHKSFSNEFCKMFYDDEYMRRAYMVIIELIFLDSNPAILRKKLNFSCCSLEVHSEKCFMAWGYLKNYLKHRYFIDLEICGSRYITFKDDNEY